MEGGKEDSGASVECVTANSPSLKIKIVCIHRLSKEAEWRVSLGPSCLLLVAGDKCGNLLT